MSKHAAPEDPATQQARIANLLTYREQLRTEATANGWALYGDNPVAYRYAAVKTAITEGLGITND